MKFFLILLLTLNIFFSLDAAAESFKIYGAGFTNEERSSEFYEKTISAIKKAVAPKEVLAYSTDWKGLDKAIREKGADLIIAGAAAYRRNLHSGLRDLFTATSPLTPDPDHVMGAVIYVLSQDERIHSLKDLKGKILGTNKPGAFQGELALQKEIYDNGYDPKNFFSKTLYFGDDISARFKALEEGKVDAIVLDTCFSEKKRELNENDPTQNLKIINKKENPYSACATSTSLYPGYSILIPPHLQVSQINNIFREILATNDRMPKGYGWTIASNFTQIDSLYKDLKIGPFEHLNFLTIKDFWERYNRIVTTVLIFVLLYIFHSVRISFLVRRRTQQLQNSFTREQQLKEKIQIINRKYQLISSRQEVSQLCSAVAHDMSQPLSAILLFSDTLKGLLEKKEQSLPERFGKEREAVAKIQLRAEKLNTVIQLVRDFAKRKTILENKSLNDVIRNTLSDFCALNSLNEKTVSCELPQQNLEVYCSSDQLELALMNLLNNSYRAARASQTVHIFLSLSKKANRAIIKIWDTGPNLSDEKLKEIREKTRGASSIKNDGLGLGLAIVRSIISLHSGTTFFGISPLGGLEVIIELPLSEDISDEKKC